VPCTICVDNARFGTLFSGLICSHVVLCCNYQWVLMQFVCCQCLVSCSTDLLICLLSFSQVFSVTILFYLFLYCYILLHISLFYIFLKLKLLSSCLVNPMDLWPFYGVLYCTNILIVFSFINLVYSLIMQSCLGLYLCILLPWYILHPCPLVFHCTAAYCIAGVSCIEMYFFCWYLLLSITLV